MASHILSLLALCSLLSAGMALVHHLTIREDERSLFKIETFGFFGGGEMNFTLSDFSLTKSSGEKIGNANNNKAMRIGFLMRKSSSETASQQDLEKTIENKECILDHTTAEDVVIDISDEKSWSKLSRGHTVPADKPGLYSLMFARCSPSGSHVFANFKLDAQFLNPGPNYLSAGDEPLPLLYFVFFGLFSAAMSVWCWVLSRDTATSGTVHRIHYMMAALLALKCLTLLFESIRFHYISVVGASELWDVVYFIFASLKGVMLFTVILLIGSGWSLMKSFLNDKEKKIIMIVLTLQVLDNVAMVVLEETAPGSQGWLRWRDILHLVDIICCCAILFPIVWSIRHLRQAAEADGKAHENLVKLQLFRQFYVMVVAYIYFTRIVVFVISSTIPFHLLWLGNFLVELATLLFFVVTGSKFRPAVDNPYLPVRADEGEEGREGEEFGLECPDEEVGGSTSTSTATTSSDSVEKRTLSSPSRDSVESKNGGLELVEPSKQRSAQK